MSEQRAAKWFIHSFINNVGRREKEMTVFWPKWMIVYIERNWGGETQGERGRSEGEHRRERKRVSEEEHAKGRARWAERAFYGKGADRGLSRLCALESLFVHNHFGITWICPPPSFPTHKHTHTRTDKNICVDTHRFGFGSSSESSSGRQKINNHVSLT